MADTQGDHTAEQRHCDAFRRENADPDIRRPAHDLLGTPLDSLARSPGTNLLKDYVPKSVSVHRAFVTLVTRRTSFDVWAALADLEELLSDYRRIAPQFHFMQTAGEATVSAGNEYRLTVLDPSHIAHINAAAVDLYEDQTPAPTINQRVMDVRVTRAGPWGGETGELVVEALRNHARAGASSLWVLAHDDADDGNMRITLDALEIAQWAWAPDLIASRQQAAQDTGCKIMNWDYLFERFALHLDGTPVSTKLGAPFSLEIDACALTEDDRISDALKTHNGLSPFVEQLKSL